MSDSENEQRGEPEDRFQQEENDREERNQIWQCFMQFDHEQ